MSLLLLIIFLDLLDCSWSDLLFISAMIKPFESIKVSVSSVCTVPNARNTRRSTALGETPLIWCCARTQNPPKPAEVSVSVGCGCSVQRGSVHRGVPIVSIICCMHTSPAASSSLQFPQQFQGNRRPGGNPSFEKGVFEVPVFCLNQQQLQKTKQKTVKKTTQNQLRRSMDGRKVDGIYCTM